VREVRRSSMNAGRRGSAVVPPASRSPADPAPARGSRVELRRDCGRRTRAPRSAAGRTPLGQGRAPPPTSAAGAAAGDLRSQRCSIQARRCRRTRRRSRGSQPPPPPSGRPASARAAAQELRKAAVVGE
jgi:hypothetical protein